MTETTVLIVIACLVLVALFLVVLDWRRRVKAERQLRQLVVFTKADYQRNPGRKGGVPHDGAGRRIPDSKASKKGDSQ